MKGLFQRVSSVLLSTETFLIYKQSALQYCYGGTGDSLLLGTVYWGTFCLCVFLYMPHIEDQNMHFIIKAKTFSLVLKV